MTKNYQNQNTSALNRWLRSAILLIAGLMFALNVYAQPGTATYINTNVAATGTNAFPFNTTTNIKIQWIYAPGTFSTLGGGTGTPAPGGMAISKVYIQFATANPATVYPNFTISLGQNVGTQSNWGTVSSTTYPFTTGLTTCFFQATGWQFTGNVANAWYGITLQTPFNYDPSLSLVVEAKSTLTTAGGNGVRTQAAVAGQMQRLYGPYANATGTSNTLLTPFGFDLISTSVCTAPPTPGTSTANPSSGICVGTNIGLGLTGASAGTGQTYQWQSSAAAGGPYTNLGSSQSTPGLNTPATSTLYYRCEVTCTGNSQLSTPVLVTVNPPFPGGVYTINSAVATGGTNFQTFTAFRNALACGISGAIVANVVAGSGPYNEQVEFGVIGGTSAVNTITINGNGNLLTFGATLAAAPGTLILNGTDYMTVNDLVVEGTGATYALVCHLWNDADNNTFSNCTFNAPANGTSTTQVPFSISGSATSATTSGPSGSNNLVTGCTIFSGYYNTALVGNSGSPNTGNQVINCNIRDQYFYATYCLYQNGIVLRGNTLDRPTRTTLSTYYGLYISTGCTNALVEKNRVRNTWATAPASTGTQYTIYCTVDAAVGTENRFYNNVISDINFGGTIYGMYMSGSDYWKAYHNTISLDETASTSTGTTYGIYCTGTLAQDVRNNIVTIRRGGTGTKYCVYYSSPAAATSNYNDLYINSAAGTNYIGYNGTAHATLAAWQAASGKDLNSVSVDPLYLAPGSYDYTPSNGLVNDIGTGLGITDDINSAARSATTPDPGAYEFSLGGLDAGISWVSPTSPATAGLYTITVNINNTQAQTITSLDLTYNDGSGPVSESFTGLNIPSGTNQNISFTSQYNLASSVTITANIVNVNGGPDAVSGNNTINYSLCISLAGTYTINAGAAASASNFQSFTTAIAALACGISSPIVFNVVAASGPYNEQVVFPAITGTSPANTITINGNNNTLTNAGGGSYITLRFNGADYVTINNLNIATTGATNGIASAFTNSSDNNDFNNCNFSVPTTLTSTATSCVAFSSSLTAATGTGINGNNNTFTGCTMTGGYYCVSVYGQSGTNVLNNRFINCTIREYYIYGVYNIYATGTVVSGCTFERPTRTTVSTGYGVYLTTSSLGCLIEKNRVRNLFGGAPTSTSTSYALGCIVAATAGNENKFINNLIYGIGGNGIQYGLYFSGANYVQAYHNTISQDVASSTAGTTYGIYSTGATSVDIRNNLVNITRGGTGIKYCLYYTVAPTFSNYNNVYINAPAGTNYFGYMAAVTQTTLAGWQTANPTLDQQSVSAAPLFINPATGNYKPASTFIDNIGTALGVSTDILNATRSAVDPDPGAYEFSLSPKDAGATALMAPGTGGCYTSTETITVEIKNYGTTPLDFSTDIVTVTVNVTGAATAALTGTPAGLLAVGATMNVNMSTTLDMTPNGTYTFDAFTTLSTDGNNDNNAMITETRTVAPVAGVVSSSQTTICVSGIPTLTVSGAAAGNIQWQESSTSVTGPWTNVGTGATTYTPATFTQTMYYQALTVCNANTVASNAVTVALVNPQIISTAPATRCGFGNVTLGATGSGQGTVSWYANATGGSSLATGNNYTPSVNSTTTFYAEENVGGGGGSASPIVITEADLGTNDVLEIQNVSPDPINVTGWKVAVNNSYTDITSVNANVQVLSGTMNPGQVMTWTDNTAGPNYWGSNILWNPGAFPSFTGWAIIIDNNDVIKDFMVWNWPSANIQGASLTVGTTTFTIGTQWSGNGIDATTVAATQSLSRQGTSDNNSLSDFAIINLSIGSTNPGMTIPFTGFGCASPRVAVTATVTPAPSLSVIAVDPTLCPGGTTTVSVSSINDPDYTYSWASNPAGYSASGAGPHSVSPTATTWYIVTGNDNSTGPNAGCAVKDSAQIVTGTTLSAGTVASSQTTFCQSGSPTLNVTGSDGGAIQWQSSTVSASGPWTNVGTGATVYAPGTITLTTWYQVRVSCQTTQVFSNVQEVTVNNPQITGSTGATRCGVGAVTLQATASSGTINWYNVPTGGTTLASGTSYTPTVSTTTTYYAGASNGGASGSLGLPNRVGATTNSGYSDIGLMFDALQAFTLTSVAIYPVATTPSGNVTAVIALKNSAGTILQSATVSVPTSVSPGIKTVVPLNFAVPAGTQHRLVFTSASGGGITGFIREVTTGFTYPYTLAGVASITSAYTGGASSVYYYYFYDWQVSSGCEGTRVPVVATVTPAPPVSASTNHSTLCTGQTATLTATSSNAGYSYTWNPGGLTGSSVIVNPATNTTYNLSAVDVSGGIYDQCAAIGSVAISVVNQAPPIASANSNSPICEGIALSLSSDNIQTGQSTGNTYAWTGPGVYSSSQQNPSVTSSATAADAGNYIVTVTNQYLCTETAIATVVVNPNPTLSLVSTNGVSCVGLCDGDVTVTTTAGLSPFLFYDANFNANGDGIFTDNQCEGNGQQIDVADANGCVASILYNIGHISSVPPSISVPNPPITGLPVSACNGNTASISTSVVPLATQYIWDGPSGTTFSGVNPYTSVAPSANITFGNPNGSGYYIGVQAANGCGASTRRVQWVRGTVSVPASITGAAIACASTTGSYSTAPVTGAVSYLWTVSGDATVSGTGTTATVTFGPTFTSGNLCVQAQTACFNSAPKCITISKYAPVVPAMTGTFSACSGQSIQYCVPAQAGIASYTWTLPPGASGTSTTNCINVTFGVGFIGGNISVTSTTQCGEVSAPRTTTINLGSPSKPASITGPVSGLCGQTIIYTCPSQAGASFNWTVPAGATINSGQGTNAISVTFGAFTTSTVCVSASNACGASAPRCITVNGAPSTPGAITSIPASWCANEPGIEFTVNVSNLTGSYTLSWIYPPPAVATYVLGGGNSTSLILNWISGSGPVHVTASNACGNQSRSSTQSNSCREGEEVTNQNQSSAINVYPNPTTGNINIEFSSISKGNASVSVEDISGRTITAKNVNVTEGINQTHLDLSKVAKGIYMLNVNSNDSKSKVKIVVE